MTEIVSTIDNQAVRYSASGPQIIATAPGRCSLIGNPSDIYGGTVISCTTAERATCNLHQDTDELVISVSGQRQTLRSTADLALRDDDYLNVARGVLQALEVDPKTTPPFVLEATTEIPIQAGLAGSTAILATITGCALEYLDIRLNHYEVAELVRKIERDILGVVCGFQDAYMVTFGGLNAMDFRDKNSAIPQDAAMAFATVEPLAPYVKGMPLLLAHTGHKHNSGSVHKSILDRWLEGEQVVIDAYDEIGRLSRQGKKALLSCDWPVLGECMNRNHAIQRDLGGSGESNEVLISAALSAGALGAKLAGAGKGGTIIVLCMDPHKMAQDLIAAGAERILYPEPSAGLTIELPV
jgi:galactokinase/mevalonate kinase-like predicted kinase